MPIMAESTNHTDAEPKPIPRPRPPGSNKAGHRAGIVALLALVGVLGLTGYVLVRAFNAEADRAVLNRESAALQRSADAEAAHRRAQDAFTSGDFGRARVVLAEAVPRHATDQALRLLYAQTLVALKEPKEALAQMEAAVAIGPALPTLHFDAGTIAASAGDLESAKKHYTLAQSKDPRNPLAPLYLAMVQLRLNDDMGAQSSLLRVTHLAPETAEAWGTLAELMLKQNSPALAIQHARRAREIQPELVRWRLVEARAHTRQNAPEEAIALLSGVTGPARRDEKLLKALSEALGLLNRPAEAAAAWSQAADEDTSNPELTYQAAVWWKRAGDLEKARSRAKAAVTLGHPQGAELLRSLN